MDAARPEGPVGAEDVEGVESVEGAGGSDARETGRLTVLAVVFGAVSVPWTLGFELSQGLPLWPSFVASASFFAAGGGWRNLARSLAGNLAGAVYGALTLWIVAAAGAGAVGLSLVVGAFMFAASLHAFVPGLSFTPAAFFGYAVLFSVHAADVQLLASGLGGELVATAASLAIGAGIGWLAEATTAVVAGPEPTSA